MRNIRTFLAALVLLVGLVAPLTAHASVDQEPVAVEPFGPKGGDGQVPRSSRLPEPGDQLGHHRVGRTGQMVTMWCRDFNWNTVYVWSGPTGWIHQDYLDESDWEACRVE